MLSRAQLASLTASATAALLAMAPPAGAQAADAIQPRGSVHAAQTRDLEVGQGSGPSDAAEARDVERRAAASGQGPLSFARSNATATLDDDFIVFGYLQSESQVFHLRWHALTHVGSRFVGFDGNGNLTSTSAFTGRSSYLKAGGAADVAGVKVVLVLASFSDGPGGALESVMTSPARRATLVSQLVQLLASDSYSHGVSLDLEFSWGPAVRDGITAFTQELRAGLDALGPEYELSIYTNAIYSANQWDFDAQTGITPSIDYMLYSMYDWASGSVARAISDFDNCLAPGRMTAYLDDGLPPEKLVPVVSVYSRRWSGTSSYNGLGSSPLSQGFTDALFDATLNPTIGAPASNYVRGDECGWMTWNDGIQRTRTYDDLTSMELKIRQALSLWDPAGQWNGRRLGGVGFWSLLWMAELSSIDTRTGGQVARTRTYPHIYQLCSEVFARPGQRARVLESFAGLDFRWRDPNESPDTIGDADGDSTRGLVQRASGDGNALLVTFDFEGAGPKRGVMAHEVLASPLAPAQADTNAVLAHVPRTTRLVTRLRNRAPAPGFAVRMLVIDADGEIEASPALSLDSAGPLTLRWNLNDGASVTPFPTAEPALRSGDGTLGSAPSAPGSADIGVFGYAVEGAGPGRVLLEIEEIVASSAPPDGRRYRINEFRYADASAEFVEIQGPAGPLPLGLELRVYDSSDGSVASSFPLFGSIPNDGGGRGYLVLGDPGTPNLDSSFGFASGRDDLSNADPTGLQIFDAANGFVHDSVVYEAFGGLEELTRRETRGVSSGGWPWLGECATGVDESGAAYTLARDSNSTDSGRNARDFAFRRATPGERNGGRPALPVRLDFETPSGTIFQTFDAPRRLVPNSSGVPASPNGGLAWRCVDTAGGGVIGVALDASLGKERGFRVRGELFVPSASVAAQAVAVGVCGSQGSTFFTPTSDDRSAYETGYWLVYENRPGVGLADGRPDHGGVWELVYASNDNMDGDRVMLLDAKPNATLGVQPGTWTAFDFEVAPFGDPADELVVRVQGQELFRGPLPAGGPRSGAMQVGFRENHAGPPGSSEGTWIDGLVVEPFGPLPMATPILR